MIIASYAGAGKTTFAQRVEGAVDLATMPRSWFLPPPGEGEGARESEKGAPYFLRDPRYPDNYILDVLRAEREYPYVLIPTNAGIIRRLWEEHGRQVILCYPTREQKEIYRARFLARGNSGDFLDIFIDGWEGFLEPFWAGEVPGISLPLGYGEFLLDARDRIDRAGRESAREPVPSEVIEKLAEDLAGRRGEFALYLLWGRERLAYRIRDIEDPEERTFLYHVGRRAYEREGITLMAAPRSVFEEDEYRFAWTDDRERMLRFLEREEREMEERI